MSEYQYVAFRALDGPVSGENLKFMEKQSTRAEITPWSFENEYQRGDFRGDAFEMMRRGYDFHLHYSSFGDRMLLIRLPEGLPDAKAVEPYFAYDLLSLSKDKDGSGAVLEFQPCFEAGAFEDEVEPSKTLARLLPLRAEILAGDLRPLFIAFVGIAFDANNDPDSIEVPPIPAGLGKLTPAQKELRDFYGIEKAVITRAAKHAPPLPEARKVAEDYLAWLKGRPQAEKDAWLADLLQNAESPVRGDMVSKYRKDKKVPAWPVGKWDGTVGQLRSAR